MSVLYCIPTDPYPCKDILATLRHCTCYGRKPPKPCKIRIFGYMASKENDNKEKEL